MSEFRRTNEQVYTPEYWDGHSKDDICLPYEGLSFVESQPAFSLLIDENRELQRRLEEQLGMFDLHKYSEAVPMAKFERGEFDPIQHTHGTLVRITTEALSFGSSTYSTTQEYAYVVDTTGMPMRGGKNGIVSVGQGKNFQPLVPGSIKIGLVEHIKDPNDPQKRMSFGENCVSRIMRVEIVTIGISTTATTSVDKQVPSPSLRPQIAYPHIGLPQSADVFAS